MEYNTAKHFVLQLGSLISLYLSLSFLIVLLFGVVDLLLPNPSEGYWVVESAAYNVRLGIAMVIVFFPTYLILTRLVNSIRRENKNATYLTLTRWLIYVSLLIGGGVLLGDLAAVIVSFLNGDITLRFIYKAITVLLSTGIAFQYYLLDVQGFWLKNEKKSIIYGVGAIIIVLLAVSFGLNNIATPATVQAQKLDEKQIQDLQQIQWRIESEFSLNNKLPATLVDLYGEFPIPTAPEGREPYTYEVTELGFKLCATFSAPNNVVDNIYPEPVDLTRPIKDLNNWQYKDGRYCFERVVKK